VWGARRTEKVYTLWNNKKNLAGLQWLMPVITAAQKAEIRRTEVQSQPGK
jgi:hypothetical protein